jgi:hypothetical protein
VSTITELIHASLLEVFNELRSCASLCRDRADLRRRHPVDRRRRCDHWRAALDAKAVELQAKLGDLQFIAAGPSYQTLGLGYLAFNVVKPGSDAPQSSGFDVAIVRGGVIAELYTVLTDQPR